MSELSKIEEKIRRLEPSMQREVERFINDLLAESSRNRRQRPVLKWRGVIRAMGRNHTSVTLQHELNKWRSDY